MTTPDPLSPSAAPTTDCQHLSISQRSKLFPPSTAAGLGEKTIYWMECDNCGGVMGSQSRQWSSMGGCGEPI